MTNLVRNGGIVFEPELSPIAELRAAVGYMRNAKIDLETGCTKATAIRTIDGGIRRAEAALQALEPAEIDRIERKAAR